MNFKKGGLLERVMKQTENKGVCKTCSNLVKISDTTFPCPLCNRASTFKIIHPSLTSE